MEQLKRGRSAERRCRVCGCTDDRACPDGCHWVEQDLCSSCARSHLVSVFRSMQGLGAAEIIRRTAAAAGARERAVGKAMKEKLEKLGIVTDVFAAFLVAAELGVMERIAENGG